MENITFGYVKKVNIALTSLFIGFALIVINSLLNMILLLIPFGTLKYNVSLLSNVTFVLSVVALIVTLVLVASELVIRYKNDSKRNFRTSINMTLRYRDFLEMERSTEKKQQLKISKYNNSIKKVVIDVRKNNVYFYLKMPLNIQAQQLIKEIQIDIKEQIANDFPSYSFSDFIKKDGHLILIGTK